MAHYENGVEGSGIVESPFGLHLPNKDLDGIAIEFVVAASQAWPPQRYAGNEVRVTHVP